ncbi:unnamed protein product [Linum tenue]|uniref:Uncharacterized protein n=1 Tax=Linum tenue TaxID=586396 RepID=A0AAV0I055_9ROSI|nr:unnamed protein product [Linum tenue]
MMGECQSSPLPLPPDFILPEGKRPNLSEVSRLASIPIIDLTHELSKLTQEISRACEDYGFFQVINHGVPSELCGKMMNSISSFFETFPEEKAKFYAANNDDDSNTRQVKLQNFHLKVNADGCSGGEGGEMEIRMWSETFSYPCHSLHEIIHLLPDNPPHYREVFAAYAEEVGGLTTRLLSLISQGLGLQKDCLQKRLGNKPRQRAYANYYPPCPSPELTLGLAVHTDPHALTLLR